MLFRWLTWAVSGQPRYLLTSRPYPLEDGPENLGTSNFSVVSGVFHLSQREYDSGIEALNTESFSVVSGELRNVLKSYSFLEDLETSDFNVVSGDLRQALQTYSPLPESLETDLYAVDSGIFSVGLITYSDFPPEELETVSFSVVGGSHGV